MYFIRKWPVLLLFLWSILFKSYDLNHYSPYHTQGPYHTSGLSKVPEAH